MCLIVLLVCLPAPALAWSDEGHKAVAQIALTLLEAQDPAAAQWWKASMRSLPPPLGKPYHPEPVGAATWPDDIRTSSLDHPTWHYRDLGVSFDGTEIPSAFKLHAPCTDCDQDALCLLLRLVNDDLPEDFLGCRCSTSAEHLAARLAWIEHLVGDVHQLLHAASLVGSGFGQTGDQGGNLFFVRLPCTKPIAPVKLHMYWDNIFMLHAIGYAGDIDPLVQLAAPDPHSPLPAFPAGRAAQTDVVTGWLLRSQALSRDAVYCELVQAAHLDQPHAQVPDLQHPVALPADYFASSLEVAKVRIGEAGIQLASVIEYAYQHRAGS